MRAFSSPGVQAPHCSGFSCCGVLAQGMLASVLVLRLQSADLAVVAHKLSCSRSCGIFWDQGLNLRFLYWQMASLLLSHKESPSSDSKVFKLP